MMGGSGMMGAGTMTPEQLAQMDAIHAQMVESGACDPAQMQRLHAQHHQGN
jgi:DNA-binding GntR family transcriptional regulator